MDFIRLYIIGISYQALVLNIPTPTPAPNRGGPVACLGGRIYCWHWLQVFGFSLIRK